MPTRVLLCRPCGVHFILGGGSVSPPYSMTRVVFGAVWGLGWSSETLQAKVTCVAHPRGKVTCAACAPAKVTCVASTRVRVTCVAPARAIITCVAHHAGQMQSCKAYSRFESIYKDQSELNEDVEIEILVWDNCWKQRVTKNNLTWGTRVFARGPPPHYWLGPTMLDCADRTGCGMFIVVWPQMLGACWTRNLYCKNCNTDGNVWWTPE